MARIAYAIRSHWAVENGLHWALDVVFDEDRSRKRVGNTAENYSRLMRVVMSLLKNRPPASWLRQTVEAEAKTCSMEYGRIGAYPFWFTRIN